MKTLIIAEKPSAARAISQALGGFTAHRDYHESADYWLSWAHGHLVMLKEPEDYHRRWRKWSLAELPMQPVFELKAAPKAKAQLDRIARLAKQSHALINACDAGREGELIFRYIVELLKLQQLPVQRLWLSALTPTVIRESFSQLRQGEEYEGLYQAAACRSEGDWLVGINGTRALTCRFGDLLSVGRVQTPTLALLVSREEAITAFEPQPFWRLQGDFLTTKGVAYSGQWLVEGDEDRCFNEEQIRQVAKALAGQSGKILEATTRSASEAPPLLFDLTSCQREAHRRFGLTAATTARALQTLYERRLISYPRTDSRYLPTSLLGETTRIFAALERQSSFRSLVQSAARTHLSAANRRVFQNAKVTDHHALLPTGEAATGLRGDTQVLYDLIARRFIAQFYPSARFSQQKILTGVADHRFLTRNRLMLDGGWRVVENVSTPEGTLAKVKSGETLTVEDLKITADSTTAPSRYNEATLLTAMETCGKHLAEEEVRHAMRERGLGTAATRATIIERLKEVGYVQEEGRQLLPTAKGMQLLSLLRQMQATELTEAQLTGQWEWRLARIQRNEELPQAFRRDLRVFTEELIRKVRDADLPLPPPQTLEPCPLCSGTVEHSSRGWHCQEKACPFSVPAVLLRRRLGESEVAALISKGTTPFLRGFVGKNGRKFQARLRWEDGIKFEFAKRKVRKKRSKS